MHGWPLQAPEEALLADYDLDVAFLLMKMQRHFGSINEDQDLTEADKKQLKDFYLQHMVAPNARQILEEHLAREAVRRKLSTANPARGFVTPKPHPDRSRGRFRLL